MNIHRIWDMPNIDTFTIPSIRNFVLKYLRKSKVSVDPFARNANLATHTNDLNPKTTAQYHMDVLDFLLMLRDQDVRADLVIFDPPYSLAAFKRCYNGKKLSMRDAQRLGRWYDERNVLKDLLVPHAIVLSFGWNSCGMGKLRDFSIEEILLVCHGGAHNDTICMAERKSGQLRLAF